MSGADRPGSLLRVRHPRPDQPFEDVDCAFEEGELPGGQRDDFGRERGDTPASTFLEESFALRRHAHDSHSAITLAWSAGGKALGFERGDDARDGGRPHLLGVGELAQGEGTAKDDYGKRGELRRGEAGAGVFAPDAPEEVDGRRVEAVGGVECGAGW